jgi:tRNA/tmRNA/rRNA uracil-C5-methylase (TrmA/RlmC/RlmD family)
MEMQTALNLNVEDDKLLNNQNQREYKLCPSRNKVVLNNLDIDYNILQLNIKLIIQFYIKSIDFDSLIIQCTNQNDVGIEIIGQNIQQFKNIKMNLKYLKINDDIFIQDYLSEIYFDIEIKRSFNSFHQNDESIRIQIYEILKSNICIKYDTFYFIGGEMYLYGKLFFDNYVNPYFYSDYSSIIHDTKLNNPNFISNIHLIDYNNCTLHDNYLKNIMLVNNGKNGLGKHLCNEIIRLGVSKIIIISCNKKSFNKDYNVLKNHYNITNEYIISSNYTIFIYILNIFSQI